MLNFARSLQGPFNIEKKLDLIKLGDVEEDERAGHQVEEAVEEGGHQEAAPVVIQAIVHLGIIKVYIIRSKASL